MPPMVLVQSGQRIAVRPVLLVPSYHIQARISSILGNICAAMRGLRGSRTGGLQQAVQAEIHNHHTKA